MSPRASAHRGGRGAGPGAGSGEGSTGGAAAAPGAGPSRRPLGGVLGLLLAAASGSLAGAEADPACAPYAYREAAPAPAAPAVPGFVLEIRRGAQPPSFLVGTFHSADPRVRGRYEALALLFATGQIRLLAVERDAEVASAGDEDPRLLPAGRSLETGLARLGLDRHYAAAARALGLRRTDLSRYRPWLAAALIAQGAAGSHPENAEVLDQMLLAHARALGVPTLGLETLRELADQHQAALSEAQQYRLLAEAICNPQAQARLVERLTRHYAGGEPERFFAALDGLRSADPRLTERLFDGLLHARNERFWARLAPRLREGGVLVAVGALHLRGRGGLIERLREAGYTLHALDPGQLSLRFAGAQAPAPWRWLQDWAPRQVPPLAAPEAAALAIEPRSLAELRRLRCPGRRCRIEATYLEESATVLVATAVFARMIAAGTLPMAEWRQGRLQARVDHGPGATDAAGAYVESLLVREMVRHLLSGTDPAAGPAVGEQARDCRANRILHRASLAQAAYLRERDPRVRARLFPLRGDCAGDPRRAPGPGGGAG